MAICREFLSRVPWHDGPGAWMGSVEIGRGRGFWPLGPRSFRMRRTRAPFLVVLAIITILVIASNLPVRPRFRDVDVRRKAAHRRDPVSQGTVGPRRRSRAPRTPFQMPSSPTILGDSGKDLRDTLASRPFPAESGGSVPSVVTERSNRAPMGLRQVVHMYITAGAACVGSDTRGREREPQSHRRALGVGVR